MSKQMTSGDFLVFQRQLAIPESHPAQVMTETTKIMSDSNASQVGGKHYKRCKIQPWDYVIANDLDYFQGSIIKYVTRWKDKGWVQDLYKARHFLEKYIEVMEKESFNATERPDGKEKTAV